MAELTYAALIEGDPRFRALADLGRRYPETDLAQLIPRLVDLAAAEHLALLAETRSILGVDGYWLAESDGARRKLIKGAYGLHRRKGTPWAVREIVRRLGFGEIRIIEGLNGRRHDGSIRRDGLYRHGHPQDWAHYRIVLNTALTNDQAALLRRTLAAFAPARCVLESLDYQSAPLRHNGQAQRNGQYNHGTA